MKLSTMFAWLGIAFFVAVGADQWHVPILGWLSGVLVGGTFGWAFCEQKAEEKP